MQKPGLAGSIFVPIVARRTVTQGACESMYAQVANASRMTSFRLATCAMLGSETLIWTLAMRRSLM